jgi:polysaccharide pyruvyl transferase WcaK-like protein
VIVEVRGANTRNKGGELMLRAVAQELEGDHRVAVEPRVGRYEERARMGLHQKVSPRGVLGKSVAAAARVLPGNLRRRAGDTYGLVFDSDIGALLDASGFAYSDQFDLERSVIAADQAERAKRLGRRVVLLPQAFGPFESSSRRRAFCRLVDSADRVYARERVSLEHVLSTGSRTDHVRLAPDFTCLLDGEVPYGFEASDRLALIVPSAKLLTETAADVRESYVPFLVTAVELLRAADFDVRLLQHAHVDGEVIGALQIRLQVPAPTLAFDSALHLKGVIGHASLVVASRFHVLVNALAQGVPALGLGWSHKYEMLFDDYGCVEHVVEPTMASAELGEHLRTLTEEPTRSRIVDLLGRRATTQRQRARAMWSDVRELLAEA